MVSKEDDIQHDDDSSNVGMASQRKMKTEQTLPLLPIRRRILLPGGLLRLTIGRSKSIRLIESIWDSQNKTFKKGSMLVIHGVIIPGADEGNTNQTEDDFSGDEKIAPANDPALKRFQISSNSNSSTVIFEFGCVARVLQLSKVQQQSNNAGKGDLTQFSLLVEGVARAKCVKLVQDEPFFMGKYEVVNQAPFAVTDTEVIFLLNNKKTNVLTKTENKIYSREHCR